VFSESRTADILSGFHLSRECKRSKALQGPCLEPESAGGVYYNKGSEKKKGLVYYSQGHFDKLPYGGIRDMQRWMGVV
jgi:hypothetical protein